MLLGFRLSIFHRGEMTYPCSSHTNPSSLSFFPFSLTHQLVVVKFWFLTWKKNRPRLSTIRGSVGASGVLLCTCVCGTLSWFGALVLSRPPWATLMNVWAKIHPSSSLKFSCGFRVLESLPFLFLVEQGRPYLVLRKWKIAFQEMWTCEVHTVKAGYYTVL